MRSKVAHTQTAKETCNEVRSNDDNIEVETAVKLTTTVSAVAKRQAVDTAAVEAAV